MSGSKKRKIVADSVAFGHPVSNRPKQRQIAMSSETDISQVIDLEEKLANAAQVIGEGMCAHSEESRLQAEASRVEAEALCLQTEALAKH